MSGKKPLLLFNLDVSLEWDARNDGAFLDSLGQAIRHSSELLYQVTDGQAALGDVRIFQNKERWNTADIVMYADNGVRPSATIGGIVSQPISDTIKARAVDDVFIPGQVRVGPNWDPFGESREELSQDWWRALAHEYGHYLLFLPDNYLGLNPDPKKPYLIRTDCRGSFMTTAYDADYARFIDGKGKPPTDWGTDCENTLAARLSGRSDWETITKLYPVLKAPGERPHAQDNAPGLHPGDRDAGRGRSENPARAQL